MQSFPKRLYEVINRWRREAWCTYGVVLFLDDLIGLCGLGGHLQPARSTRLQLLHLPHVTTPSAAQSNSNTQNKGVWE